MDTMLAIEIVRTHSDDARFQQLASELEAELQLRDGEAAMERAAINEIPFLSHAIIGCIGHQPVACGAFRVINSEAIEIKRMFVSPVFRKQKIATTIHNALEAWAIEKGHYLVLLETGKNQPEAIAFYQQNGYSLTAPFGAYVNNENSICFQKRLSPATSK